MAFKDIATEDEDQAFKKRMASSTNKKKIAKKLAPDISAYTSSKFKDLMKGDTTVGGTAVNSGKQEGSIATVTNVGDIARTARSATKSIKASTNVATKGKGFFDKDISKGVQGAASAASMGMDALGIGGENDHSDVGNVASGALGGFSAGMQTGNPMVAVGGAVVGGVAGLAEAGAKRKEAKAKEAAKAKAMHAKAMVNIEAEKGQKIQAAMSRMGAAFSKNLKGKEDEVKL